MDDYIDWEIEQGRVGAFYLGMTKEELVKKLEEMGVEYKYTCNGNRVEIYGLIFVFEPRDNREGEMVLQTIFVSEGFQGKFKGKMGIGTIPCEMEGIEYYGEMWSDMYNLFILPEFPGVTFSVEKNFFVSDQGPICEIRVTNENALLNSAIEYREDEQLRKDSRELMEYFRS